MLICFAVHAYGTAVHPYFFPVEAPVPCSCCSCPINSATKARTCASVCSSFWTMFAKWGLRTGIVIRFSVHRARRRTYKAKQEGNKKKRKQMRL